MTLALGAELLALGGLAENAASGRAAMEKALASGAAAERFERMVALLGGPGDFLAKARSFCRSRRSSSPFRPARAGFVEAIDARGVGMAVVALGGGRSRARRSDRSRRRLHRPRRPRRRRLPATRRWRWPHARDEAQAMAAAERLARALSHRRSAAAAGADSVIERIAGAG